jgi:DNA-binding transcriptional MerR regulator
MFAHYNNDPVFNVRAMAHQTGVAAATLRAWERRYGVPSPPRTDSGYRLYSARDAAIVRWLKSQLETGLTIGQAVQLLRTMEQQPANELDLQQVQQAQNPAPSSLVRLQGDVVAAALAFDEERVERALGEAFSLFSVEAVCQNVIQGALVTLGDKWHSGAINVSVEHFATHILRRKLLALMASAPMPSSKVRIVSACAPSEYHDIGILMISLFLRRNGYHVIYLGQNIAMARIDEMLAAIRPDVLLLSASSLVVAANLLDISVAIHSRPAHDHPGPVLAFGGRAFDRMPQLARHVPGAYIGGNAEHAVVRIGELLAGMPGVPFGPQVLQSADAPAARALRAFRLCRPEIVAAAARLMHPDSRGFDQHRLAAMNESQLTVLDAAVRLDEPSVLNDTANWMWDALPPHGLAISELQQSATALVRAARGIIPAPHLAHLEPFLDALESAVHALRSDEA